MKRNCGPRVVSAGFTLIEALIALSIFSFLGVGAYQLLSSTGALMQTGEDRFAAVSSSQVALRLLEEDFTQLSPRPVSSGPGKLAPALDSAPQDAVVQLTRSGWRNPLGVARSSLQRVSWAIDEDGNLLRRFRGEIDAPEQGDEISRIVARGVEALEIRYLDEAGKWSENWPPTPRSTKPEDDTSALLPVAAEIVLIQQQIGELSRVVSLR